MSTANPPINHVNKFEWNAKELFSPLEEGRYLYYDCELYVYSFENNIIVERLTKDGRKEIYKTTRNTNYWTKALHDQTDLPNEIPFAVAKGYGYGIYVFVNRNNEGETLAILDSNDDREEGVEYFEVNADGYVVLVDGKEYRFTAEDVFGGTLVVRDPDYIRNNQEYFVSVAKRKIINGYDTFGAYKNPVKVRVGLSPRPLNINVPQILGTITEQDGVEYIDVKISWDDPNTFNTDISPVTEYVFVDTTNNVEYKISKDISFFIAPLRYNATTTFTGRADNIIGEGDSEQFTVDTSLSNIFVPSDVTVDQERQDNGNVDVTVTWDRNFDEEISRELRTQKTTGYRLRFKPIPSDQSSNQEYGAYEYRTIDTLNEDSAYNARKRFLTIQDVNGGHYEVQVQTITATQEYSNWSETAYFTIEHAFGVVDTDTIDYTIEAGKISFTWDGVVGATQYHVSVSSPTFPPQTYVVQTGEELLVEHAFSTFEDVNEANRPDIVQEFNVFNKLPYLDDQYTISIQTEGSTGIHYDVATAVFDIPYPKIVLEDIEIVENKGVANAYVHYRFPDPLNEDGSTLNGKITQELPTVVNTFDGTNDISYVQTQHGSHTSQRSFVVGGFKYNKDRLIVRIGQNIDSDNIGEFTNSLREIKVTVLQTFSGNQYITSKEYSFNQEGSVVAPRLEVSGGYEYNIFEENVQREAKVIRYYNLFVKVLQQNDGKSIRDIPLPSDSNTVFIGDIPIDTGVLSYLQAQHPKLFNTFLITPLPELQEKIDYVAMFAAGVRKYINFSGQIETDMIITPAEGDRDVQYMRLTPLKVQSYTGDGTNAPSVYFDANNQLIIKDDVFLPMVEIKQGENKDIIGVTDFGQGDLLALYEYSEGQLINPIEIENRVTNLDTANISADKYYYLLVKDKPFYFEDILFRIEAENVELETELLHLNGYLKERIGRSIDPTINPVIIPADEVEYVNTFTSDNPERHAIVTYHDKVQVDKICTLFDTQDVTSITQYDYNYRSGLLIAATNPNVNDTVNIDVWQTNGDIKGDKICRIPLSQLKSDARLLDDKPVEVYGLRIQENSTNFCVILRTDNRFGRGLHASLYTQEGQLIRYVDCGSSGDIPRIDSFNYTAENVFAPYDRNSSLKKSYVLYSTSELTIYYVSFNNNIVKISINLLSNDIPQFTFIPFDANQEAFRNNLLMLTNVFSTRWKEGRSNYNFVIGAQHSQTPIIKGQGIKIPNTFISFVVNPDETAAIIHRPTELPYISQNPNDPLVRWNIVTANANFPARHEHTSVVFNDKIYVIGGNGGMSGFSNDVWSSTDGRTWTQETANAGFEVRREHTSVVFNDKIYVIGGNGGMSGFSNDVWSSTDGRTWTQETANANFLARAYHTSVVFNDKIYVIGGIGMMFEVFHDVWSSTNGRTWTQETANANFLARAHHTSVVFNNKMWVIGGIGVNGFENDVWSSVDGRTWTQETANAGFEARGHHTSIIVNNKMYVIGGDNGTTRFSDVWSSLDGRQWVEETADAGFTPRSNHTSVVFNKRLWIIAGYDGRVAKNDVYYSQITYDTYNVDPMLVYDKYQNVVTKIGGLVSGNNVYLRSVDYRLSNEEVHSVTRTPVAQTHSLSKETDEIVETIEGQAIRDGYYYNTEVMAEYPEVQGNAREENIYDVITFTDRFSFEPDDAVPQHNKFCLDTELFEHTDLTFARLLITNDGSFALYSFPKRPHNIESLVTHGSDEPFYEKQIRGHISYAYPEWRQERTASTTLASLNNLKSIVFNNKLLIAGGLYQGIGADQNDLIASNNIWETVDGYTWTQIEQLSTGDNAWTPRYNHALIEYNDALYLLGGRDFNLDYTNIFRSDDGITWTKIADNITQNYNIVDFQSVVFDYKMWVMGGLNSDNYQRSNTIYTSVNGIDWDYFKINGNPMWEGRSRFGLIVHNNRIFVLGGLGLNGTLNDIWEYFQGQWTQITPVGEHWSARYGLEAVVHNDELYIIGGQDDNFNILSDIWKTGDNGRTWERVETTGKGWYGRANFTVQSFAGGIMILGGIGNETVNDHYYDVLYLNNNLEWITEKNTVINKRVESPFIIKDGAVHINIHQPISRIEVVEGEVP